MCGIAGIVMLDPREKVEEIRLRRMRDVLRHRGPDNEGVWIEGPVGLAHRRLAIMDVAGGNQPMPNEDYSAWIVYNGEIYNHPELHPELEARGHHYRTRCDTETILHLYEEEGDRCVERLRGMFAFALWDRSRRRLLLARDRLGIKPLYYACTDNELLFASEIKAILAAGSIRPEFNKAILPEFLATRYVSGEETFFKGIKKLLPGRTMSWSLEDGLRERRYWRLSLESDDPSETGRIDLKEQAMEVREQLRSAVQSHLMSDVPLGVFLSGGLDSSGLAALVSSMVKEPVSTFAVGFADPEANELAYARRVAQSLGTRHRELIVSPTEFFHELPRLVWHEDEPIAFPSSIPLYFLSRLAREDVKVVLTGEGADELFLGYNRYRVTAINAGVGRAYWGLVPGILRRNVCRLMRRLPAAVHRYAGRSFLALEPGARDLFYENFAVFPSARQEEILSDRQLLDSRDPYAESLRCYDEGDGGILERMSRADLQTYLVELLMKQDQMSMAASIESRVPYLDHEFVESMMKIPGKLKLRGWKTKAVLREALRGLVPPEILARKKMGFPVPVGRWLRGPFSSVIREFVLSPRALDRGFFEPTFIRSMAEEHLTMAAEHGDRLWLLVNLEIWHRIFIDGEDLAAVSERV